jgi:hypothetical protein
MAKKKVEVEEEVKDEPVQEEQVVEEKVEEQPPVDNDHVAEGAEQFPEEQHVTYHRDRDPNDPRNRGETKQLPSLDD